MTFREFVRRAAETSRTIRIYGDVSASTLADLRQFFDASNVRVEVVEPPSDDAESESETEFDYPRGTVALERDGTVVETSALEDLVDYVSVDELGEWDETLDVVAAAEGTVTGFVEEGRRQLVRGSQVIEELAWHNGMGTLHAGFQRFSRLRASGRTRTVFRRLAESGVDVHVYGVPDAELPDDVPYAVHPRDDEETRDHWFVTYASPGTDECAALVARQVDEAQYTGFWTLDPERARPVVDYVEETYAND